MSSVFRLIEYDHELKQYSFIGIAIWQNDSTFRIFGFVGQPIDEEAIAGLCHMRIYKQIFFPQKELPSCDLHGSILL